MQTGPWEVSRWHVSRNVSRGEIGARLAATALGCHGGGCTGLTIARHDEARVSGWTRQPSRWRHSMCVVAECWPSFRLHLEILSRISLPRNPQLVYTCLAVVRSWHFKNNYLIHSFICISNYGPRSSRSGDGKETVDL